MRNEENQNANLLAVVLAILAMIIVLAGGVSRIAEGEEILQLVKADSETIEAIRRGEHENDGEIDVQWAMLIANHVNFRKGPGLNHDVCCQWSYGVMVEVIEEKDGWCRCFHWTCPEPVWIWGEYLKVVD